MNKQSTSKVDVTASAEQSGFSLIETVIALIVLMIAVIGVFGAFAYSTRFNTGNSKRSQSLSVLQRELEFLRSAKFTPTITDSTPANIDLTGGTKTPRTVTNPADNSQYLVETWIDDNPFAPGIQTVVPPATTTMKEIRMRVTPRSFDGQWVIAYRTQAVIRRVRSN
jgi:type II secretory pathway pseudopilin PulG